jgi:hypothetical protein
MPKTWPKPLIALVTLVLQVAGTSHVLAHRAALLPAAINAADYRGSQTDNVIGRNLAGKSERVSP